MISVGDEQWLNDSNVYNATANWLNSYRGNFPNTLLYTNQWGTEVGESLMVSFGCTGGQHRSVYAADALARHLRNKFKVKIELKHCVQDEKNWINEWPLSKKE